MAGCARHQEQRWLSAIICYHCCQCPFRGAFYCRHGGRRQRERERGNRVCEALLCHLLSLLRQITFSFAGPLKLQIARVLAVLLVVCLAIFWPQRLTHAHTRANWSNLLLILLGMKMQFRQLHQKCTREGNRPFVLYLYLVIFSWF